MDLLGPARLLMNDLCALVRYLYFVSPGYPQVFQSLLYAQTMTGLVFEYRPVYSLNTKRNCPGCGSPARRPSAG